MNKLPTAEETLSKDDIGLLNEVLELAIKVSAEDGEPEERRTRINNLYKKINGLKGSRRGPDPQ